MKILIAAPYLYDGREFTKNKTGFGMMVNELVQQMDAVAEVGFVSHAFTKGHGAILPHRIWSLGCPMAALPWLFHAEGGVGLRLRAVLYRMNQDYFRKMIQKFQPDIVHIHGFGLATKFFIDCCLQMQQPFVVTAHGLLEDATRASQGNRELEREYLRLLNAKKIPVSVVGTGMKQRLLRESYYGLQNADAITVIPNGIDVTQKPCRTDIRQKFHIPQDAKLLLAVGSVCKQKNQRQLVRILPKNTWLLLVGTQDAAYPIAQSERVMQTGFVPHEELGDYYRAADLVVTASLAEGFGLSLVEGFVYGTPCVTFADLDAVADIFDENAMLLCKERTDEAFAQTVQTALQRDWDAEKIVAHSKKFSREKMRDCYLKWYEWAASQ